MKYAGPSGVTAKRPALLRRLKTPQLGDTLTVWNLDRLGRSLQDFITMLDYFRGRGVKFHSLLRAPRRLWGRLVTCGGLLIGLLAPLTNASTVYGLPLCGAGW